MIKKQPRNPNLNLKREFSAGLIVYRRTRPGFKFLILYHGGSYWNFPKGHIEPKENSLKAAIRETCEETGLKQNELRIINNFKTTDRYYFRKGQDRIFKLVNFYLAETRTRNVKISDEHYGFGWFLYPQAVKILTRYHGSQRVLKQAYGFISQKSIGRRQPNPQGANPHLQGGGTPSRQARGLSSRRQYFK